MPKLSANVAAVGNPDNIVRIDLTPEMIKTMTDDEITTMLAKLRPDREVAGGPKKRVGTGNSAPPRAAKSDEIGDDEVG